MTDDSKSPMTEDSIAKVNDPALANSDGDDGNSEDPISGKENPISGKENPISGKKKDEQKQNSEKEDEPKPISEKEDEHKPISDKEDEQEPKNPAFYKAINAFSSGTSLTSKAKTSILERLKSDKSIAQETRISIMKNLEDSGDLATSNSSDEKKPDIEAANPVKQATDDMFDQEIAKLNNAENTLASPARASVSETLASPARASISETLGNKWDHSHKEQISIDNRSLQHVYDLEQQQWFESLQGIEDKPLAKSVSFSKPPRKWYEKFWFARNTSEVKTDAAGHTTAVKKDDAVVKMDEAVTEVKKDDAEVKTDDSAVTEAKMDDLAGNTSVVRKDDAAAEVEARAKIASLSASVNKYMRSDFSKEAHELILPFAMVFGTFCSLGQVILMLLLQLAQKTEKDIKNVMHRFLIISLICGILGFTYVFSRLCLHMVPPTWKRYQRICYVLDEVISLPAGMLGLAVMTMMIEIWFGAVVVGLVIVLFAGRWIMYYKSS